MLRKLRSSKGWVENSFALFGHYKDEEGLQRAYAIPERLETFVETVNNYITLQRKSNSEKRVAIYYYKGPGQNALTAGGMEVVFWIFHPLFEFQRFGIGLEINGTAGIFSPF